MDLERIVTRARRVVDWRQTWIWFARDLGPEPRRHELAEGCVLRRLGPGDDLTLIERLSPDDREVTGADPRERLREGAVAWAVERDGEPLFTCWTFLRRAPAGYTRSGWLELPAGVAMLEDSIAAPSTRGSGIPQQAVTSVCATLRGEGYAQVITRIRDINVPSIKAVRKVEFAEVARTSLRRNGPWIRLVTRASANGAADDPAIAALVAQLRRRRLALHVRALEPDAVRASAARASSRSRTSA